MIKVGFVRAVNFQEIRPRKVSTTEDTENQ